MLLALKNGEKMGLGEVLLFCFAVIGLTNIIVDPATIMQPVRKLIEKKGPAWLNKLVSCYQCTGTWVGFITGAILFSWKNPFIILVSGLAGSFVATFGATFLSYIEGKVEFKIKDE
jgi:hypothetical protein